MDLEENKTKNGLIYCRVSTQRQADEGWSLDAQERFCRKYADDNGFRIVGIFSDEGKSGTNVNRAALQDLLIRCQDKDIDTVFVQETDRLARNTQDHLAIKAIFKKYNTKLVSVAQPMFVDSPEGRLADTMVASFNQFQSEINSRKTKKGMKERFDNGWWPAMAKLGYLNKQADKVKIIARDPERWHLIKEGLKMYLTGNYSAVEISDKLYKKGLTSRQGKKICNSIMINIIKDSFYTGIMKWGGYENVGKHEPMITPKEHRTILTIMDSHNNHACRRRIHNYLLRGFLYCGICGQRYVGEKHKNKNKNVNIDYYHCSTKTHSNKGQHVEIDKLEKEIEEQFLRIRFTKEFIDLVIQKVKNIYEEKKKERNIEKRIFQNKIMKIEENREKTEIKLIEGTLKDDDYIRIRDRFKSEINRLQGKIYKIEEQREIDIDVARETLLLARDVYGAYKKAPYEVKRLYLSLFWNKFLIKDKKITKSEPTELIRIFLREKTTFNRLLIEGRIKQSLNRKLPENKGKIRLTPNWLRIVHNVRTSIQENNGYIRIPDVVF